MTALVCLPLLVAAAHGADSVPPDVERISFPAAGEEGPMLEGELCLPQRANAELRVPGVVICHPHPQMGGTMHDPVVIALRDRLLKMGIATLRFNFRGVGESQGEFDEGVGEVNDVLGAVAALRARPQVDARHCGIVGYSFGAEMGLRAAAELPHLPAYAGVGFPTGLEEVNLDDYAYLEQAPAKMLFVTGTEDQYSSVTQIQRLLKRYEKDAQIVSLKGTDHFFSGPAVLGTMAEQVALFMAAHLIGEP